MDFPSLTQASLLSPSPHRLFVGAYGFEERSLGWVTTQQQERLLSGALVFRYKHSKGRNRARDMRQSLRGLGVAEPRDIPYDVRFPHRIEDTAGRIFMETLGKADEVVVDISAMTKLLILVCLSQLRDFPGTLRIVYSEAEEYSPTKEEYEASKHDMELMARFPSRGVASIIRMKCLSSIRMQGQPVSLVAFTSFNEQLVRHILGTISPHRLLFINGRPPREEFAWREAATQDIHRRLMEEYVSDNPLDQNGLLHRVASTLDYNETITRLEEIYKQFGTHERIICAATGSKMQTVGLFFGKVVHPDIHIEYPTPDSYFVKGMSEGIRNIHEIVVPGFASFLKTLRG